MTFTLNLLFINPDIQAGLGKQLSQVPFFQVTAKELTIKGSLFSPPFSFLSISRDNNDTLTPHPRHR